jgi:putative membrane protein
MSMLHVHQQWAPVSFTACALLAIAAVYFRGWVRLRRAPSHRVPTWRLAAFLVGLLALWAAACSPLATLDHRSLTAHMLKHLIIMTIAAPLVLAAMPRLPLLNGLPIRFARSVLLLGGSPVRLVARFITHPVFCWVAATTTVIGWHLPIVFGLSQHYHWIHGVQDVSFFLAGLLFWWPVVQATRGVQSGREWSTPLYLFLATLPCDILSAFLVFCNRVVYSGYAAANQMSAWSPLQDQECAGALMWVWVTFAYLIPAAVITVQMLSAHEGTDLPVRAELASRCCNSPQAEVL